ncbi:MAG: Uma2 family endonuclease [Desulfobacterales bacterium]|nr:Uma2 family endonuclease [Desulfobacterales bacterium]
MGAAHHHYQQINLLIETIHPWLAQRADDLTSDSILLRFSLDQVREQGFQGSDFSPVPGFFRRGPNNRMVCKQGRAPDVVIDLVWRSSGDKGETGNKPIPQDRCQAPEYFWFNLSNPDDWGGYTLRGGSYKPLPINGRGRLPSPLLGLALVRWQGAFQDVEATWLRWARLDGSLLPTEGERVAKLLLDAEQRLGHAEQRVERAERIAEEQIRRAETAAQRADAEAQRAIAAEAEVTLLRALLAEQDAAD